MNVADQLEHYCLITKKLKECVDREGNIYTENLGEAALLFAPVYDWIFGFGVVAKHLQKDIINHASSVINTAKTSHDYFTVESLIKNTLKTSTLKEIRKTGKNGIVDLLWTKRCMDFITKFLSYGIVEHIDKSLHSCASMAYEEVLKPYHGIMISTIVSLAFNIVTSREKFIKQLGFTNIREAQAALEPFLKESVPIVSALNDLLERDLASIIPLFNEPQVYLVSVTTTINTCFFGYIIRGVILEQGNCQAYFTYKNIMDFFNQLMKKKSRCCVS